MVSRLRFGVPAMFFGYPLGATTVGQPIQIERKLSATRQRTSAPPLAANTSLLESESPASRRLSQRYRIQRRLMHGLSMIGVIERSFMRLGQATLLASWPRRRKRIMCLDCHHRIWRLRSIIKKIHEGMRLRKACVLITPKDIAVKSQHLTIAFQRSSLKSLYSTSKPPLSTRKTTLQMSIVGSAEKVPFRGDMLWPNQETITKWRGSEGIFQQNQLLRCDTYGSRNRAGPGIAWERIYERGRTRRTDCADAR